LLTFFVSGLVIVGVGSLLTARWIVRPLESLSRAARALGSGDLSARSGLVRRDEVGEVGRAFDEMAARVETLMLAERELLANVSHELRTPLARIRVALDIAGESGQAPGPMAEIAADLSEIEKLVDDILTAARLDVAERRAGPGGFELRRERATVEALVAHAAELFRGRHPERRLDVAVDAGLPDVDLDRMLLRRALDNLLDNAHKYSPDASKPVALRAVAAGEGVAVEVVDRGVGISPEDQKHLFTPFFRAERSRSRGTGGVGLGLLLARRIVDAHGGNLEITSAPGDGTTARITLPPAPRS
jgi:signal transduction histidine kinase